MAIDQATEGAEFLEQATNVFSIVSSATPSVNVDQFGWLKITALAADISAMAFTGTPVDGQILRVRIKDNGSGTHTGAYSIAWGSGFESVGATLPVATTANKRMTVTLAYDAGTSKFGCIASVVEA